MTPENQKLLEALQGKLREVIVHQFFGWWTVTPEAWIELVERSIAAWETDADFTWDWDDVGRRFGRPPYHKVWTGVMPGHGGRSRRCIDPKMDGVLAYNLVCDWKEEEWREARRTLEEMAKCNPTT